MARKMGKFKCLEEQLSVHVAQPMATHIEQSLDETRAQVVQNLVAEGIRQANFLEKKVEQLFLANQQKFDAHMLQFCAEQQDRLSSFTQGAISEVQLQVNCFRSEKDQIQHSQNKLSEGSPENFCTRPTGDRSSARSSRLSRIISSGNQAAAKKI